jgi:hypothetical protein
MPGISRDWIQAVAAKRVTARNARGRQPGPANDPESVNRFSRIVRARRQVPARAGKHRRKQDFVEAIAFSATTIGRGVVQTRQREASGVLQTAGLCTV